MPDDGGHESEEDAGVAECSVHRCGPATGWLPAGPARHRLVPFGAVTRPGWAAM